MTTQPSIIDLGSEVLVDRTRVRTPQIQLLLAAIGQPVAAQSAWVAVNKRVAALYDLPREFFGVGPRSNKAA
jgi:hypothetical protein